MGVELIPRSCAYHHLTPIRIKIFFILVFHQFGVKHIESHNSELIANGYGFPTVFYGSQRVKLDLTIFFLTLEEKD